MLRVALVYHDENKVRKALRPGGQLIIDDAKRRVRVDTGLLRDSIKFMPKWKPDPWGIYVGPRVRRTSRREAVRLAQSSSAKAQAKHAAFIEYGTTAHNLGYKGKYVSGKGADHPGSKPHPYMRPAYDTMGQEALDLNMNAIWKMIEDKISRSHIDVMVANKKGGRRLY